jgi:hypothetical protein
VALGDLRTSRRPGGAAGAPRAKGLRGIAAQGPRTLRNSLAAQLFPSIRFASLPNAGGLLPGAHYNTLLNLNFCGNLTLYV